MTDLILTTMYESDAKAKTVIDVPPWVDAEIDIHVVASIYQGGCAGYAYLPACEYVTATDTMAEHGDEVLEYLEDSGVGHELMLRGVSWGALSSHLLMMAIDLWAGRVYSAFEKEMEDIAEWAQMEADLEEEAIALGQDPFDRLERDALMEVGKG